MGIVGIVDDGYFQTKRDKAVGYNVGGAFGGNLAAVTASMPVGGLTDI